MEENKSSKMKKYVGTSRIKKTLNNCRHDKGFENKECMQNTKNYEIKDTE